MGEGSKTESSDMDSDGDSKADAEEEEEPLPPAQSDWLPPVPVTKNKFLATPTYVDDNCFIYLHDTEKSKLRAVCNMHT
jgi:hypothetical protein